MKNINILFKVYHPVWIVLFMLTFYSCEQLIETDLPDNQVTREDVFKDMATTEAALTNLYINVRENPFLTKNTNGISYNLSLYTDELDYFANNLNDFYTNTVEADHTLNASWWDYAYSGIYAANDFIEGLSQSAFIAEADKKAFLGEAYFIRSLYYQYLCQLYGDIPYTLTTDYVYNTAIAKTSYAEMLIQIEKDLKTAVDLLDDSYRNQQRIYPNQSTAKLLLAQNYLLQKKYEEAEKTCLEIINNNTYQLESDLDKVFKKEAKSTLWQLSSNSDTDNTPEASAYIFVSLPPPNVALSTELLNIFETSDKRKQQWIKEVTDGNLSFFHAYKYKNKENNTDEYSVFFRVEEVYFMLAEALTYQNRTAEAIGYINIIRQRAGLNPLPDSLNQDEFIDEMLKESQREFFTENGHRFFDLKRNGKLEKLSIVKPNWQNKHQLFPIPERQLQINPNLQPNNNGY